MIEKDIKNFSTKIIITEILIAAGIMRSRMKSIRKRQMKCKGHIKRLGEIEKLKVAN